jgi:hypothetical protein
MGYRQAMTYRWVLDARKLTKRRGHPGQTFHISCERDILAECFFKASFLGAPTHEQNWEVTPFGFLRQDFLSVGLFEGADEVAADSG